MIKHTSTLEYFEYQSVKELDPSDQELHKIAVDALAGSYAPYSRYRVASSILLENGEIVIGSNQENAAYPSGLCAERVAIFSASSNFPSIRIKTLLIVVSSLDFEVSDPAAPCGACRQAILEYEIKQDSSIRIILVSDTGRVLVIPSCKDLLPIYFIEDQLKKD